MNEDRVVTADRGSSSPKLIDKFELYKALTGVDRANASSGVSNPVTIDTTIESEMDKAYLLVKKMERIYSNRKDMTAQYYRKHFQEIEKAYLEADPAEFKGALKHLVSSIYWE